MGQNIGFVNIPPTPTVSTLASLRRKRAAILDICEKHGGSNPRVFGSMATGSADPAVSGEQETGASGTIT